MLGVYFLYIFISPIHQHWPPVIHRVCRPCGSPSAGCSGQQQWQQWPPLPFPLKPLGSYMYVYLGTVLWINQNQPYMDPLNWIKVAWIEGTHNWRNPAWELFWIKGIIILGDLCLRSVTLKLASVTLKETYIIIVELCMCVQMALQSAVCLFTPNLAKQAVHTRFGLETFMVLHCMTENVHDINSQLVGSQQSTWHKA